MKKLCIFFLVMLLIGISQNTHGQAPPIEWENNFGGISFDVANSIQQTTDGGYIVAGSTLSSASGNVSGSNNGREDYWIVKLDNAGNLSWETNLGGNRGEIANSIQQTTDGGYIVAGYTRSSASGDVLGTNNGNSDFWIVKLDNAGNLSWETNLGGSSSDEANSIQQTTDGGYIVAGYTLSSASGDVSGTNNGSRDFWIVKLDNAGNLSWETNLGGNRDEIASSIHQTTDGGYIVAGFASSSANGDVSGTISGRSDFWIVKLDNFGNLSWETNLGGSSGEIALSIQQSTDGGYIVAGFTRSSASGDVSGANNGDIDFWIVKLDNTGNLSWETNLGGTGYDAAYSIQQTIDGGYIASGISRSPASGDVSGINNGSGDYWVVKLDNAGNLSWETNLGGSRDENAKSIQQTTDRGYIMAGLSRSSASGDFSGNNNSLTNVDDFWIVKLAAPPPAIANNDANGDGTADIADPCSCNDPLNVNIAGQYYFHELITITSPPTETWQLQTLNSGSIFDNAGNPLTPPLNLTETTAGVYNIDIWHLPNTGYNADFNRTAAPLGTALSIGNSCAQVDEPSVSLQNGCDLTNGANYSMGGEFFIQEIIDLSADPVQTWEISAITQGNIYDNSGVAQTAPIELMDLGGGNYQATFWHKLNEGFALDLTESNGLLCIPAAAMNTCRSTITNDDPSIEDPCSCFDPNNYMVDGQIYFHEIVTINSVTGETWQLTNLISGPIFDNMGNDISGTIPINLTETPPGSGIYTLDFWHLPNQGYDAQFNRTVAPLVTPLQIANSCTDCNNIPTVSEWGLIIFGLLLACAGIMVLRWRRKELLSYEI